MSSLRTYRAVPNLISLARIPLAAVFPLAVGKPEWAVVVLVLAGATDILDGWYARRFHQMTEFGAVLDGIMDKAFVITVAATMLIARLLSPLELLLIGARDLGEVPLLLRWLAVPKVRRRERAANQPGKLATFAQFACITAVLLGAPHRGIWIAATGAAGAMAALSYLVREWKMEPAANDAS